MQKMFKRWWDLIKYEPGDPRLKAGGTIKIAVIGGGTGLSTLLRGLKKYSKHISAVVTMVDNGASTGRLRKDFGVLPPGDIRQCLTALASDEAMLSKVFKYRFEEGEGVKGHALGNLLIVALEKITGSFGEAVHQAGNILAINGEVLPATLNDIQVGAILKNGRKIMGEADISHLGHESPIGSIFLEPDKVRANPDAVRAIAEADLIVIGPGSLYTSVATNFLIFGIRNAVIENKSALKVYIANCSTERGETENFSVHDHIRALFDSAGSKIFDYCVVNTKVVRRSINDAKLGEVNNITTKETKIDGVKIIRADVVSKKNPLYHDPDKLAQTVIELYNSIRQITKT